MSYIVDNAIAFEPLLLGGRETVRVTLKNRGTALLRLSPLQIEGEHIRIIAGPGQTELLPGETTAVIIEFTNEVPGGIPLVPNEAQTYEATCGLDGLGNQLYGTPVSVTIAAGTHEGATLAEANAIALALARIQAEAALVCHWENTEQTATCPDGYDGSSTTPAGTYTSSVSQAEADALALAAAETVLECETPPWVDPPVSGDILTVAVQADGKIVIGGDFDLVLGVTRYNIARLNTDGSLDSSFIPIITGGSLGRVYDIKIQPDQKILVAGNFTTVNGAAHDFVRLNSDGTTDATFTTPTFTTPPTAPNENVYKILVLPSGNIVVGGLFLTINGNAQKLVAMLSSTGALLSTVLDLSTWNIVNGLAQQSDGRIIVGGGGFQAARQVNGQFHKNMFRLNTNWTVDHTFNAWGDSLATNFINDILVMSDDALVVGGQFTAFNGQSRNDIFKYNAAGTVVDVAFNPNVQSGDIQRLVLDASGKIIVNGTFGTVGGVARAKLARLNSDGSLDTTWPDYAPNSTVFHTAVQTDAKVVIVGNFTVFAGGARSRIARLFDDGTIDI